MGVTDSVPGMDAGCTVRNVAVGALYLTCLAALGVVAVCYRPYRGC